MVDDLPRFSGSGQLCFISVIAGVVNKFIMLLYTIPVEAPRVLEPKLLRESDNAGIVIRGESGDLLGANGGSGAHSQTISPNSVQVGCALSKG
jgi:hypothetical protein